MPLKKTVGLGMLRLLELIDSDDRFIARGMLIGQTPLYMARRYYPADWPGWKRNEGAGLVSAIEGLITHAQRKGMVSVIFYDRTRPRRVKLTDLGREVLCLTKSALSLPSSSTQPSLQQ